MGLWLLIAAALALVEPLGRDLPPGYRVLLSGALLVVPAFYVAAGRGVDRLRAALPWLPRDNRAPTSPS